MNGFLILDKPSGPTSRMLVDEAARWFPRGTKLGHAGTLDPSATGVLVLGVGWGTRLIEYVQEQGKTYLATIALGATSTTDDADGTITPHPAPMKPSLAAVRATLTEFVGTIEQVPPRFSAVHIDGVRAHQLARKGLDPAPAARPVRIDRITLLAYCYPMLRIEVACGKGTYIRALARDLGERLRCGGYITELRRTRVGEFRVEDAVPRTSGAEEVRSRLLPLSSAVPHLRPVVLDSEQAAKVRHGQVILFLGPAGEVRLESESGTFIGLGEIIKPGLLRATKVAPAGL